jgi:hypothetical protein
MTLLLKLLALFVGASMTATWARPGVVDVAWQQNPGVRETCLLRKSSAGQSFVVQCWPINTLPAGPVRVRIGGQGSLDANYRGQVGDTWRVTQDGQVRQAQLVGVVRLPVVRH